MNKAVAITARMLTSIIFEDLGVITQESHSCKNVDIVY